VNWAEGVGRGRSHPAGPEGFKHKVTRRQKTSRDERLLKEFKTFCVICRRRIAAKRHRRNAITCKDAHQRRLTKLRKMQRDRRACSHCSKPVTPDQIAEFRLWSRSQAQDHAKHNKATAKAFRGAANGTHALADFAYIVTEGPKLKKRKCDRIGRK
jgi:hypothetical protein